MNKTAITKELLDKYEDITKKALLMAKEAIKPQLKDAEICIDMAERYLSDAIHFRKEGEFVLAYGAINYAHGWLDCGARLKLFIVHDSKLFTVDD